MDSVRLDKWLWAARFYKTRNLASQAVNGGHVHINEQRCKAARPVKVGDTLKIRKSGLTYIVTVNALSERRGSASDAQKLFKEHEESLHARELHLAQRKIDAMANPRPAKRPDKRQRRLIKNWKSKI